MIFNLARLERSGGGEGVGPQCQLSGGITRRGDKA